MMIIKDLLSIQQIPSETLEEVHGGSSYYDVDVDVDLDVVDFENLLDVETIETMNDQINDLIAASELDIIVSSNSGEVEFGFGWKGMTESDLWITVVGDYDGDFGSLQFQID